MDKVLTTLDRIDQDECRRVMVDYDSFINRVQHKIYIQTFIGHYRNAEKLYLNGNNAGEKKSLMYAHKIFKTKNITNDDLSDEKVRDYKTSKMLTSEIMMIRLRKLQRDEWI
ncbi:hypothetical protein [Rhodohalobacter sp. SW132]|nr:hypothetical protein [Rhodohalobacter sp. SW132]